MIVEELKPEFYKFIPTDLEEGILYITEEYQVSVHLCPCGCKNKIVLPFTFLPKEMGQDRIWWLMTKQGETVSFDPSIGNNQIPCKTHYYIKENKILHV